MRGVREIATGNFKSRISIPMNGELGELLNGFNAMASQLEDYDNANIEELKAAQVKQQSLIATMADGAILLNSKGNIVLVNPTARRLFRWEGRNLEGKELLNELPEILANDEELEVGEFELGIFRIKINKIKTYERELIKCGV